jgi:hypothetical protein
MAYGERSRAYGRVGSSAARAFRTAMAGAPFDRPRQERAEGRRRCARGSWPNRRTGMAKRTVVGCRQRNREGASRSAERSGGMVGIGRDGTGRTWRGSAGAGRHTARWSRWAHAVEGNQIRGHLEPDLRRTQRHTPPHTAPRSRSPLVRGGASSPLVPIRGGVGRPASPRASSATRPLSPPGFVSYRFVSSRFVSFRLLRLPADPPPIGEVDREEPYRPRL